MDRIELKENVSFNSHKDIREAPTAMIATGNIVTFGLPDEMIHMVTSIFKLMPEKLFRQKIREMGPTLKPFPFNQH